MTMLWDTSLLFHTDCIDPAVTSLTSLVMLVQMRRQRPQRSSRTSTDEGPNEPNRTVGGDLTLRSRVIYLDP